MTKLILRLLGVLAGLMGAVWMLQGLGYLAGSVMTGQIFWFWMGLVAASVGAGLIVYTLRSRGFRL